MARRMPPRNRKGRFMKRGTKRRARRGKRRKNSVATVATVTTARQPNRARRRGRRRSKRRKNPVAPVATVTTRKANPSRARRPKHARRPVRRARRRANPVTLQANAVRRSRRTGRFKRGGDRRRRKRGKASTRSRQSGARRVRAKRRNTHYKSVGGYRRKGRVRGHRRRVNPVGLGGLMKNQFSRGRLAEYGVGVLGLGIGVTIADLVDRYVATMPPSGGQNPYFGRNAAAAQQRRPDVMRLGAQGLGALIAMVLTYVTRNVKGAPWLFGGLAGGFGVNLVQMGTRWFVMPMLLKSDNPNDPVLANRLYPLEQKVVQDPVTQFFENWTATPTLAASQAGGPVSASPLAGGAAVYMLGKNGQNGQRRLIPTGKLGACASCGGNGGCYEDCPDYNCEGCGHGDARYQMEHGDDMGTMTAEAGVDAGVVYGMNLDQHGRPRTSFTSGEFVRVPHALGRYLQRRDMERQRLAGVPDQAVPQAQPASVPAAEEFQNGKHFVGANDAAMGLMFDSAAE